MLKNIFQNPKVIITIFLILGGAIGGAIGGLIKLFSNKKTLLTGPIASGKTTFLRHISKEEIPDGPSGAPKSYKVKGALFNEVTDFSGAEAWLENKLDEYIKEHDYILLFFDVFQYLKDPRYRDNVGARIDFIHSHKKSSQVVLLVGTHIDNDKITCNYKSEVEHSFAGKSYQEMLGRIVYINTQNKKCVETIYKELKK